MFFFCSFDSVNWAQKTYFYFSRIKIWWLRNAYLCIFGHILAFLCISSKLGIFLTFHAYFAFGSFFMKFLFTLEKPKIFGKSPKNCVFYNSYKWKKFCEEGEANWSYLCLKFAPITSSDVKSRKTILKKVLWKNFYDRIGVPEENIEKHLFCNWFKR